MFLTLGQSLYQKLFPVKSWKGNSLESCGFLVSTSLITSQFENLK